MGREIRFRAWDSLEKRYVFHDSPSRHHHAMSLDGRYFNMQNGSGGDEYVLQQYTGRKDKTGKDVYEGDIVRLFDPEESYGEVVWVDDPSLSKPPQWGIWVMCPPKGTTCSLPSDVEVVGDVFSCSLERILGFFRKTS